jgi:hypothetical protein
MRKFLGLVVTIACTTMATADSASAKKIKQVLEAKMACTKAPSDLNVGPEFLSHVKRACEGKAECSVGPGEVFAAADMEWLGVQQGILRSHQLRRKGQAAVSLRDREAEDRRVLRRAMIAIGLPRRQAGARSGTTPHPGRPELV